MTNKQSAEGWQKQFDSVFVYVRDGLWAHMVDAYDEDDNLIGNGKTSCAYMVPEAIKSFISNLLEDIAVACEEKKSTKFYPIPEPNYHVSIGFNEGLDTAANLIRSLKNHE